MTLSLDRWLLAAAVGMTCLGSSRAETPLDAPAPPVAVAGVPAEEDARVSLLQKRVALQEAKVRALTEEMVQIDAGIERDVDLIIERLSAVTDSTDSDVRVANQKREIIVALKKSIDFYRKQREQRKAQLLQPTYLNVPDEDLKQDIATLDARVEERIDQIMQITASLAQDTDYDQYDRYITDNNGNRRVNREVRQAENSTKRAVNAKGDVADGLVADKAKLESEIAKLEQQAARTQDADTRAFLEESIAWNRELVQKRDEQIAALIMPAAPAQQPITAKASNELDRLFDGMRLDIKADYQKLLTLKSRRDQERAQLKRLTDALAQASAAPASPAAP